VTGWCSSFHERLIQRIGSDKVLGPTWLQLFAPKHAGAPVATSWWENPAKVANCSTSARANPRLRLRHGQHRCRDRCGAHGQIGGALGIFNEGNWHPAILRRIYAAGLTLECVSQGELEHALCGDSRTLRERVLFTPNFAPRSEYEYGFQRGVHVTLDNLYPLKAWPELFQGRDIFVRIDPGFGAVIITMCAPPGCIRSSECCRARRNELAARWPGLTAYASSACTRTHRSGI